jgi:hypothetical protein
MHTPHPTLQMVQIIGTVFTKKGQEGDFDWQIQSGRYEHALFLFNEDESRAKWKKAGAGNAVIRKYNKYAVSKPRSTGILTGTKEGGYPALTAEIRAKIDACFIEVKRIVEEYGYTTIYYSAKTPNGPLGTSIFQVHPTVIEYITEKLHTL